MEKITFIFILSIQSLAELGGAVAFGAGLGYERYLPVALKKDLR